MGYWMVVAIESLMDPKVSSPLDLDSQFLSHFIPFLKIWDNLVIVLLFRWYNTKEVKHSNDSKEERQ